MRRDPTGYRRTGWIFWTAGALLLLFLVAASGRHHGRWGLERTGRGGQAVGRAPLDRSHLPGGASSPRSIAFVLGHSPGLPARAAGTFPARASSRASSTSLWSFPTPQPASLCSWCSDGRGSSAKPFAALGSVLHREPGRHRHRHALRERPAVRRLGPGGLRAGGRPPGARRPHSGGLALAVVLPGRAAAGPAGVCWPERC